MAIKKIKRSNIGQIKDRLEKRLKAFETAHGLTTEIKSMRYTDNNVTITLTLSLLDKMTKKPKEQIEREDFLLNARNYGFSPALLDKKFNCPMGSFTVAGYRSKARKDKFIIANMVGKKFVCDYHRLHTWLTAAKSTSKYIDPTFKPDYGVIMGETNDRQKKLDQIKREIA